MTVTGSDREDYMRGDASYHFVLGTQFSRVCTRLLEAGILRLELSNLGVLVSSWPSSHGYIIIPHELSRNQRQPEDKYHSEEVSKDVQSRSRSRLTVELSHHEARAFSRIAPPAASSLFRRWSFKRKLSKAYAVGSHII